MGNMRTCRTGITRCGLCLLGLWGLRYVPSAAGLELAEGELRITPRITAGSVSWDELRTRGGHKSTAGLGVNADYVRERTGLGLDVWYWHVSEGLDSNEGVIPKSAFRIGADLRRLFPVKDDLTWYPYIGLAYETWNRDRPPPDTRTYWESLDFLTATVGAGLTYDKAYAKLGVSQSFMAKADRGDDPNGRVGFESEVGMRLRPLSLGLFWRGNGFQNPDTKLIHAGMFLGYEF